MTLNAFTENLCLELENLFKDFDYKTESGEERKFVVYRNALPVSDSEESPQPFPYLLVRCLDGEITEEQNQVRVFILIGVFDSEQDNQGVQDVLSAIELIRQNFGRTPLLKHKFQSISPIKWTPNEEDTYPFYFGGVEIKFLLPATEREDPFS